MKHYKCHCGRERFTEDKVMMAICGGCQEAMVEVGVGGLKMVGEKGVVNGN